MSGLISVVLPVFNAEQYLAPAVSSMLKQSYRNIEVIAINDGSTDRSLEILNSFKDSRLKIINNEKNCRLIKTLQVGLTAATGDYIARMDADDISHKDRLKHQMEFMIANPETAVLGTWFEFMNMNTVVKFPVNSFDIQNRLLFSNSVGHPTVMINRKIVGSDLYYSEDFVHAEDYELWCRLSRKYKIANLDKVLLRYRIHASQVSNAFSGMQNETVKRVRKENLKFLESYSGDESIALAEILFGESPALKSKNEVSDFAELLISQNKKIGLYDHESFQKHIKNNLANRAQNIFEPKYKSVRVVKDIVKALLK